MLARLQQTLNRPLFGTRVIPPDARVDAARFPEAEFPIYCPKCEYLLRGLPDGRCPECGEPFERGHLLVLEYVRWRVPQQQRFNRFVTRLLIVTGLVLLGVTSIHGFYNWRVSTYVANPKSAPTSLVPLVDHWKQFVYGLAVAETGLLLGLSLVVVWMAIRYRKRACQRRQVIAAVPLPVAEDPVRSQSDVPTLDGETAARKGGVVQAPRHA